MDMDPNLFKAGIDLGSTFVKSSAQTIMTKIKSAKATGDNEKIISNLEEIINELISDRNQLIQLTQSYEEKMITQKISEGDIEYITENIYPIIETLLEHTSSENAEKTLEALNLFKPILSKELFNIVQLLGFNFKSAIGEPLTDIIKSAITSKISVSNESRVILEAASLQRESEFYKVMQDEEAFQRYLIATGKAI